MSKAMLRASMLAHRRRLDETEQAAYGREIQNTFLGLAVYQQATTIALYLPVNGEVPTETIVHHAQAAGKTIYLPVIEGERIVLQQFLHPEDLKPGKFGILEPSAGGLTAEPHHIDVFVIPGVVFDLAGNRGGYGKGYYDRLLHSCCPSTLLVGFCYDFQVVEKIAAEPHDVRMNMVITERRVIPSYC